MSIDSVQKNWEAFAQTDPLWSILSDDAARNNRWNVDAFFATGRKEIDGVLAELEQHVLRPPRRRALDFGCGVGRSGLAVRTGFRAPAVPAVERGARGASGAGGE